VEGLGMLVKFKGCLIFLEGGSIRIKAVVGPAFVVGLSLIVFIILIVSIFIGI
jgi:hypothetical protein